MIISEQFEKILREIIGFDSYSTIEKITTKQMLKAIILFILNGGYCEVTKGNTYVVCENEIVDNCSLENDLGADSLDMLNIFMYAEDFFSIEIYENESDKIKTFNDFVQIVENKGKAKIGARPWIKNWRSKIFDTNLWNKKYRENNLTCLFTAL